MESIKELIDINNLPQHVAIIMDGNGRWATTKGQDRTFGHKNAIQAVRNAINACNEINIPYLTLYTFSSENWSRPEEEIETLMALLSNTIIAESEEITSKGLRMHVIGDIEKLPTSLQEQLHHIMAHTANNTRGNLILALSYGSQLEITNAVKQIAQKVVAKELNPNDINEKTIEDHLYTKNFPAVDLLIRTSGEVRISNFLLWQIAYAEMQFLETLWPDFSKNDFFNCILNYQKKQRRYGKTGAQIELDNNC